MTIDEVMAEQRAKEEQEAKEAEAKAAMNKIDEKQARFFGSAPVMACC